MSSISRASVRAESCVRATTCSIVSQAAPPSTASAAFTRATVSLRVWVHNTDREQRGGAGDGDRATAHYSAQLTPPTRAHAPGSHKVSGTHATAQRTAR